MANYIIAILLALVCTFGYVSYSSHETIGKLEAELVVANDTIEKDIAAIEVAGQSCKTGQAVTKSVSVSINKLQEGMTKQLEGLAAITATTLEGETKDVPKATTAPRTVPDDAHISPELERLLQQAYCANSHDSACTAD
jgi:hypothetical protein